MDQNTTSMTLRKCVEIIKFWDPGVDKVSDIQGTETTNSQN